MGLGRGAGLSRGPAIRRLLGLMSRWISPWEWTTVTQVAMPRATVMASAGLAAGPESSRPSSVPRSARAITK